MVLLLAPDGGLFRPRRSSGLSEVESVIEKMSFVRTGIRTSTLDHFEAFTMFDLEGRAWWHDDEGEPTSRDIKELDFINSANGSRVLNTEENLLVELLDGDGWRPTIFVKVDRGVERLVISRNRVRNRGEVLPNILNRRSIPIDPGTYHDTQATHVSNSETSSRAKAQLELVPFTPEEINS